MHGFKISEVANPKKSKNWRKRPHIVHKDDHMGFGGVNVKDPQIDVEVQRNECFERLFPNSCLRSRWRVINIIFNMEKRMSLRNSLKNMWVRPEIWKARNIWNFIWSWIKCVQGKSIFQLENLFQVEGCFLRHNTFLIVHLRTKSDLIF